MGGVEEVAARVVEHGAPTGHGSEDADAEEAERRFGEDGSGHSHSGLHEDGLQNIGEQVAQENAGVGSAERARGEHVFHFLGLQNLSAGKASVAGPAGDDQREDNFAEAGAEESGEGDGQ